MQKVISLAPVSRLEYWNSERVMIALVSESGFGSEIDSSLSLSCTIALVLPGQWLPLRRQGGLTQGSFGGDGPSYLVVIFPDPAKQTGGICINEYRAERDERLWTSQAH